MILKNNIIKAEQGGNEINVDLQLRVLSYCLSASSPGSRACSKNWGASPEKQE